MDGQRRVLVQYGIPLFFYQTGMTLSFFKTEKYGFWIYFKKRV